MNAGTLLIALLALPTFTAAADFDAPTGFNGHEWGASLESFGPGLQLWSVKTALAAPGKMTDVAGDPESGEGAFDFEGEGSHAMAEYLKPADRNPWALDRIQLLSNSYLFCYRSKGNTLPTDMRERLTLCGVRVKFTSDTEAQLLKRPGDYRSNYDRIMRRLVIDYGEPPGYEVKGTVIVDDEDRPEAASPTVRNFVHYRWCGMVDNDRELYPDCSATVSLAYDPVRGEGVILFAAHPLYAFAWAVHMSGDEGNEVYRMLSKKPLEEKSRRIRRQCTGTHVCQNVRRTMNDRQRSAYELPAEQSEE